ncbi:MAG: SDR family oxidoreductase [Proteobacteria bacterium]|nr:SDR family oxidoreductase [Pseudomonadota bacterium]
MTTQSTADDQDLPSLLPKPGTRIVIAGGCGELGQYLVRAAMAAGLNVIVLDRDSALKARPVPKGAQAMAIDGADDQSIREAFTELSRADGGFDHLVFLIGFSPMPPATLADTADSQWDAIIAVNLRLAFQIAKAALPTLKDRPGASLTFVSSALTYGIQKGYGPYIAAKSGLNGLVRAMAIENAPEIRVNAVAPSVMVTPFLGGGTGQGGELPGRLDWFNAEAAASAVPMGRLCKPQDVVGPLLFLASDAARFITGQILHVNGGRLTP